MRLEGTNVSVCQILFKIGSKSVNRSPEISEVRNEMFYKSFTRKPTTDLLNGMI